MIANAVFLLMVVAATGLACVGAALWVELAVREHVRRDVPLQQARRRWT